MIVGGDYEIRPGIDADRRFRQSAVLIVLCTSAGMRNGALQHRAAAALVHTHESMSVTLIPLLLDPGADSTTMFGPDEWLAPTGSGPSCIAHDIFEAIYARASPTSNGHAPVPTGLGYPPDGSQRWALAVVRQAFARATFAERTMRTALVAVLVLSGVLAVVGLSTNQAASAVLMLVLAPVLAFSGIVLGSHLASLKSSRRG